MGGEDTVNSLELMGETAAQGDLLGARQASYAIVRHASAQVYVGQKNIVLDNSQFGWTGHKPSSLVTVRQGPIIVACLLKCGRAFEQTYAPEAGRLQIRGRYSKTLKGFRCQPRLADLCNDRLLAYLCPELVRAIARHMGEVICIRESFVRGLILLRHLVAGGEVDGCLGLQAALAEIICSFEGYAK